ncbi:hypothetical protein KBD59_04385 [Candidatus Gracilibacteria bacterium]|nr:hypothetical protein [Candidatus Gracilibacteria bacterium]
MDQIPSSTAPTPQTVPPAIPNPPTTSDERFFAALAYFGPLFVFTLVVKPKSEFCRYHARQSMVLFLITFFVLVMLLSISWLGSLLTLSLFAVYVLSIYKAYHGEIWKVPFVSGYAEKINIESLYGKAGVALSAVSDLKDKAADVASQAGQNVQNMTKNEEEKKQ